jgi:hypothetical protein
MALYLWNAAFQFELFNAQMCKKPSILQSVCWLTVAHMQKCLFVCAVAHWFGLKRSCFVCQLAGPHVALMLEKFNCMQQL